MPARVGIEIAAGRCRVVEADVRLAGRRAVGEPVRVRQFHTFEWDTSEPATLTAGLKAARSAHRFGRSATVTLWGIPGAFHFLRLPPAAPVHLENIARREAADDLGRFAAEPADMASGIILGGTLGDGSGKPRREVAFVAASAAEIRGRIDRVSEAGFTVDGVTTPAVALISLARLLPSGRPGAAVAHLALGADASSLVVTRDGFPLFAREMPWGYHGHARRPDREALVERLASELRRSFLLFRQTFRSSIELLVMCGDYADLRSLTAPLIASLGVEIETLDTPEGIDLAALPAPEQRFREQLAALRLAWAAAVDSDPPVNLLPAEIRTARRRRRQGAWAGAGAAAGIALSAALYVPADRAARDASARVQELRQTVARLEPIARQRAQAQQSSVAGAAQQAALEALGQHGPRLARLLDDIASATPAEVTLTSLALRAEGTTWRAEVSGLALASNPAVGQAAVNSFLRGLADSPYVGGPITRPTLRVHSGSRTGPTDGPNAARLVPEGRSGVEFAVEFPLPR